MKLVEGNLPFNFKVRVKYLHDSKGRITSTTCQIVDKMGGGVIGVGQAWTNKNELHPTRKAGRRIAVGRAMVDAGFRYKRPTAAERAKVRNEVQEKMIDKFVWNNDTYG